MSENFFSPEEQAVIEETKKTRQERKENQAEFLDKLSEQTDVEVVETEAELIEGVSSGVRVELTGELEERMAEIEHAVEQAQKEESIKDVPEVADRACQMLADMTTDPSISKDFLYTQVYRSYGLETVGKMLEGVFKAVETQRERDVGAADGFRKQQ